MQVLGHADPLSSADIQTCFRHGSVWLETSGKPRRLYDSDQLLHRGNMLHLYCNHTTLTPCPYRPQLIRDFETFSIWYKPAGMLSQGSKWGDHWALYRWLQLNHWPQRQAFITHRLDRFTRGLMIVAHQASINRQFHRLFEQHEIRKTYRAVVQGQANFKGEKKISTTVEGKTALSLMRVLDRDDQQSLSLIEIQPQTGRKHQIRRQLSGLGLPVKNDRQYGQAPFAGDMELQASELAFNHPLTGERLCISVNDDTLLSLPPRQPGTS